MSKIAILSPQPRTSGVVTYSHHLKAGFRKLGHECDVVTFTLSGKPSAAFTAHATDAKGVVRSGWGWSPLGFDRCDRWDRATEVLKEYDVIVVEEPRCAPLDKRHLRKIGMGDIKVGRDALQRGTVKYEELPPYIDALANLQDQKIAITLHDPGYGFRLAPFLQDFMLHVQPDIIVTHRDGSLESAAWAGVGQDEEVRIPHLPYEPVGSRDQVRPTSRVIGMTGRYINNKGQPTLALVAALGMLPKGFSVDIAGASPLGAGPNHTFLTFEGLTKEYGFKGKREGSDVTRGWPWRASRDKQWVSYTGPYDDPMVPLSTFGIHVNGTDAAFSGSGSIEYSTLEAMDAGCIIICPTTQDPKEGRPYALTFEIEKLANAELKPVDDERRKTAENLAKALTAAAWIEDTKEGAYTKRKENYDVIDEWHDPARYARKVLEAL